MIAPELFAAEDAGRSTLAVPPALLGRYSPRGGLPLLRQAVAAIEAVPPITSPSPPARPWR
ncbi:hypothetical protein ACFQ4K_13810 [Tistrella bauzanensis]